jgi:hypothetical protein
MKHFISIGLTDSQIVEGAGGDHHSESERAVEWRGFETFGTGC